MENSLVVILTALLCDVEGEFVISDYGEIVLFIVWIYCLTRIDG